MSTATEPWLVRMPNGQVIRANSTQALRHHVATGRIPRTSQVRRPGEFDWAALSWTPEVADLMAEEGPGPARLGQLFGGPTALEHRPFGVRGLAEELLQALDTSLRRAKLRLAFFLGLSGGLGLTVLAWLPLFFEGWWLLGGYVVLGALCLTLLCLCANLITQMTYVELAHLRPARPREITQKLGGRTRRLALAYLFIGGLAAGSIALAQLLPRWTPPDWNEAVAAVSTALTIILACMTWPLLGMALLLPPILVIEENSLWRSFQEWLQMVRRHLGRVFLAETLALALGLVMTLPILVPVLYANYALEPWGQPARGLQDLAGQATLALLGGAALAPLLAYLCVANVFIYLNLKYEFALARNGK